LKPAFSASIKKESKEKVQPESENSSKIEGVNLALAMD